MQTSTVRLHKNIATALADDELAKSLANIKEKFVSHRAAAVEDYNSSGDFDALREYGKQMRDAAIADMPALLETFERNARAAGAVVLWAKDAARARELIVRIAQKHQVKTVVKSKSMATEEIFLNDAFAVAGVSAVETDLGEFIIQLAGEKPTHIIAPAMHKNRGAVEALFRQHAVPTTGDDIPALTRAARNHLREKFIAADMGLSGANFLLADSGSALIVTNEGNGRMVTTLPPVHVTVAGIDKILPTFAVVPPMLTLLTRSATGQKLSNYVSITTGNRRTATSGGPKHVYIVLIDNGRAALRDSRYREMLRCIRCGACMNHCPVYHTVGGHAYGSVYMGPMGQVLTPALVGVENASELPYMATMCGACAVVCPVKIPLPTLMRRLREERVRKKLPSRADRLFITLWGFCATHPFVYGLLTSLITRLLHGAGGKQNRLRWLPGLAGWFGGRDLTTPPTNKTFRQMWKDLQ